MKSRLTLVLLLAQFAHAQPAKPGHWVATWGTAQLLVRPLPPATPPATPPAKQAPAAQGFYQSDRPHGSAHQHRRPAAAHKGGKRL